jgi:hypothetical protein
MTISRFGQRREVIRLLQRRIYICCILEIMLQMATVPQDYFIMKFYPISLTSQMC